MWQLNVVDDQYGTPVVGFEKMDFQLFLDCKMQTIAVFEREASSPLSIVLAIDTSQTVLTSERLEKEAAKHFVQAVLREQDELDLMDFSDTVREIVPCTNQVKRVEQGLNSLQQGDETALYNAIYLASKQLGQTSTAANRRRVLVVISDGGNQSEESVRYEQAVEQAQRAGAIIYSIIVVPDCYRCGTQYRGRAYADPDVRGHGRQILLRRGPERPGAGVPACVGRPADAVPAGVLRAGEREQGVSADPGEADRCGGRGEVLAALPDGILR